MGTKSKKMRKELSLEMEAINNEFTKCEGKFDYFKDRMAEFLDTPLLSDKRKDLYGQMKSTSLQLLPLAENIVNRIRPTAKVPGWLDAFDGFLGNYALDKQRNDS